VRPVRTAESNLVYLGPTPDIRDLHCEREREGVITSIWWLTAAEREAIARGANIRLTIWTEPIPPVSMAVIHSPGIGEDAPDILDRLESLQSPEGEA
jgi:hypothetical protein